MGTVYRKTVTRKLPADAEIITRQGERLARWKDRQGKPRTAKITVKSDGSERITMFASTFTAKYRNADGIVCEVPTGCREEQAARRILADLERRAELVKSGVMTSEEDAIADHQTIPLAEHFEAYLTHQRSKGLNSTRIRNSESRLRRLATECEFRRLGDFSAASMERWLSTQSKHGMSAGNRNEYRQELVGFGNWCVRTHRLISNPFADVAKADAKADRRRHRRALNEDELRRLVFVASLRPLAEYGRESVRKAEAKGRSTWEKATLTFETVETAVERAREQLADNPAFVVELEARGRERALIYKSLILTGLRKGELASITVGQIDLDADVPYLTLNAADEKNRQGNSLPLRADLSAELRDWLAFRLHCLRSEALRGGKPVPNALPASTLLFDVPAGLVRIFDRDLQAAGIPKRDERHPVRGIFPTARLTSRRDSQA